MKNLTILILIFFVAVPDPSEARRRRKKGVVIVNQVLKLEGKMTNNGLPAAEFSGIKDGDTLETDEKSFAIIRIPGLGIFRMNENTRLRFTKFINRNETQFDLTKGKVLALFKRAGVHNFRTLAGSVHPQQAYFAVAIDDEKKTDAVCVFEGKAILSSKNSTLPSPKPSAPVEASASPLPISSAPGLPMSQIIAEAKKSHESFQITEQGVVKDVISDDAHSENLIETLESLYSLP